MRAKSVKEKRTAGQPQKEAPDCHEEECSEEDCNTWYKTAFRADYLARYSNRSDQAASQELPFIHKSLGLREGALVLDLCCGAGRHSRGLAAAGYRVIGMDLSMDLLQAAQAESDGKKTNRIDYVRGDMRCLPFGESVFDGGINVFTSFGYFTEDAENLRSLREASRVLKPGAPFVMDFFNLKPTLRNLVPRSEKTVGEMQIEERRFYRRNSKRIEKVTRFSNACGTEARKESVRAFSPAELLSLFRKSGLRVIERFGDLEGSAFDLEQSPRCVLLAEKDRKSRGR